MSDLWEIRIIDGEDATSSGSLRVSRDEATGMFEADCATLSPGMQAELIDCASGEVVACKKA